MRGRDGGQGLGKEARPGVSAEMLPEEPRIAGVSLPRSASGTPGFPVENSHGLPHQPQFCLLLKPKGLARSSTPCS